MQTYYRPGLVFKAHAKAQGHQECCRRYVPPVYTPDGAGIVRDEIPALWAEFGVYGGEYTYIDPDTERTEVGTDFRGGWFDLDAQADVKGWGPAEKEIVARHMLRLLEKNPGWAQFSLHSKAPAAKPWPTYDETHHNQIPTFAEGVGLVNEALAYERENKARDSVIQKLEELLERASVAEELTAA